MVLFIFIAVFPGFYAGPGGGHCPAQGQAPAKLRGEAEARGQRGGRVLLRGRVTEVRHVTILSHFASDKIIIKAEALHIFFTSPKAGSRRQGQPPAIC